MAWSTALPIERERRVETNTMPCHAMPIVVVAAAAAAATVRTPLLLLPPPMSIRVPYRYCVPLRIVPAVIFDVHIYVRHCVRTFSFVCCFFKVFYFF